MCNIVTFTWTNCTISVWVHGRTILFLLSVSIQTVRMTITIHAIITASNISLYFLSIPLLLINLNFKLLIFFHFIFVFKHLKNLLSYILLFNYMILYFLRSIFYSCWKILFLFNQILGDSKTFWIYYFSFRYKLRHKLWSYFIKLFNNFIISIRSLKKSTIINLYRFRLFNAIPIIFKSLFFIHYALNYHRFWCICKGQYEYKILS